ncbi:MAG: response regulator [Myxococcaceae bacterium]|nr:response regulator [Myxococcaceae bacterium]
MEAGEQAKANILIVDDTPANLMALEAVLEPLGQRLVKASSGPEALMHLLREDFACILLDVQMPGMDGFETARLIKSIERTRHIPLLFITALSREEAYARRGYSEGAVDFIVKPVDPDILLAKVKAFVDLHGQLEALRRQRKRADMERQLFFALVENSSDFIGIADAEGRPIYVNPAGRRMVGLECPPEDTQLPEYYAPEARAQAEGEILPTMVKEGHWAGETLFRHFKTGAAIPVSDTHFTIREAQTGTVLGYGTITRDITERKRADAERERLLREVEAAHARLRRLFEHAPAIVISLRGPEHIVEMVNPLAQRIIASERSLVGLSLKEALPEMVKQGFIGLLDGVYRTGQPFIGREMVGRSDWRRVGRWEDAFFTFVYQPRHDAQGQVEGIDIFGFDVTEQVHARQEAEVLTQELRHAVQARDNFLSVASHELKTPLTPLSLKLQSLTRAQATPSSSITLEGKDLEVIRRQVKRLSDLINSLLDVSRISTGQLKLDIQPVDLSALARDMVERFAPMAERAGCTLELETDRAVMGRWDPLRLEQVITNLLSNALKYGAGKPVHLRVEAEPGRALLIIRDEGIGIAPEVMSRIFRKFERGVSDRNYGGLGLGLYVARELVEAMGGHLKATSAPNAGATFTVELPLGAAAPR